MNGYNVCFDGVGFM